MIDIEDVEDTYNSFADIYREIETSINLLEKGLVIKAHTRLKNLNKCILDIRKETRSKFQ